MKKEGYLDEQSLHFKTWKKTYIVLKDNHLYRFTDNKKTKITKLINLSTFKKVQFYKKSSTQFQLISDSKKEQKRVFAAKSMNEAVEWIKIITESMDIKSMFRDNIHSESI